MSVKTCQLCGKPLGRIRGDGDFCSSEHRNQFRLRRGMDRLEEANKVASLMRRRENPRQIPASQLMSAGSCAPRGGGNPIAFPARQMEPRFSPLKAALLHGRIAPSTEQFSNPLSDLSRRSSAPLDRHVTPAAVPFVARRSTPALEPRKSTKPSVGVVRASTAPVSCQVAATESGMRECGAVLRVARKPVVAARQAAPTGSGQGWLEKSHQWQPVTNTAIAPGEAEAQAYPNREFTRRRAVLRARPDSAASPTGLPKPQSLPGAQAETRDIAPVARACDIPRTPAAPRFPRLKVNSQVSGTSGGQAAALQPPAYESAEPAGPRGCRVVWEIYSPVSVRPLRAGGLRAAFTAAGRPLLVNATCDAAREHRPAQVAFGAADSVVEPPPIALHSVFPAPGAEPPRSSPERLPLQVFEEHFDSGLKQWSGDTVDWKLDAAGARPAGLALFRPTIGLADYEFEFFTRIEYRTVNFIFRAVNVSNYFKVTIAMVESGRYELRRCAVIGGMEEPAASSPLPGVLRPGTAFTVKTRASQNDFMIWLDGELAARWTDGRLPNGGIGFMAPRDDRARVYWVRLSQLEGPNSQAATHRMVRSIQ